MADRRDEIEYLQRKAAQFRKLAADYATPLSAQMVEMAVALQARAASIDPGSEPAKKPDTFYRVYFRTRLGTIAARDEFTAADDSSALVVASELCDACSDICASFELWDGVRRVDTGARRGPLMSSMQVSRRTQEIVVEREMIMRDSEWLIAKSKRLLQRIQQLIDARGPRQ